MALLSAFHAEAYAEMGDGTAAQAELNRAEAMAGHQAFTLAKLDDLEAARAAFADATSGVVHPKPLAEAEPARSMGASGL